MLSQDTIAAVKSTIPVLANAGVAVTQHFYDRMFKHNPELKHVFNMSNQQGGAQPFALFNALAAYATYIDDLDKLASMVSRIANKHVSLDIQAEHYPIVGKHLLATLGELAPETFDGPTLAAWEQAYQFLANAFIDVESTMYHAQKEKAGGWNGRRQFEIVNKVKESELVTSFYFKPTDGEGISDFSPGQFITVNIDKSAFEYEQKRQYSLSQYKDKSQYRISVKRELTEPLGLVSNFLHDQVEIGSVIELISPAGDFVLKDPMADNVFISAGVGITPMLAMLEATLQHNTNVTFLHACINDVHHAFKRQLAALNENHEQLQYHYWYEQVGRDLDAKSGFINVKDKELKLPIKTGEFYLCGPIPFMRFCRDQLVDLGVTKDRIHYEVFGPHNEL